MRFTTCAAIAMLMLATPVSAQEDRTLADIRAELAVLYGNILTLKNELAPSVIGLLPENSDSLLDRVVSIEQSLAVLTAQTEELQYQIEMIVTDGTNRVGDLEFRLCELEPNCDISALGETPMLGGNTEVPLNPVLGGFGTTEGEQLAVAERADFDAAQTAMSENRYQEAERLYRDFMEAYPSSPLGVQAQMGRGKAFELLGNPREAGRAYLAAFSLNPQGSEAPSALLQLGRMMAAIGQFDEACLFLGEVGRRFPSSDAAVSASDYATSLSCQ